MHDQFIDHAKSLWVAATGAAGTGAGATGKSVGGTVCKQASQVETKCINWVVIAYMHDQFIYIYIYHSPGWLRPLEPLAWAQAQVLRPQGLAKLHVALPAGITSRDRRYQLYEKGGYCIYHDQFIDHAI